MSARVIMMCQCIMRLVARRYIGNAAVWDEKQTEVPRISLAGSLQQADRQSRSRAHRSQPESP
eukprot:1603798-Rhodomonas_salina.1